MPSERDSGVVAIGSDHAGYVLKERLKNELERIGYETRDVGTGSEDSCDYPDFARPVAEMVARGEASKGVLVCGTGAGMAMVANKVPGIRAAACNDPYTAEYCRLHNDANILTLGSRVIDTETAVSVLKIFMETGFEGEGPEGERHLTRLEKISGIENSYLKER